ncbi:uncharacterized protein LOC128508356 [Clarias gariepinus]|uniref:uncharacterized protein LOC128508356 n=1 Tax=Clarias gariepinus TaxID=13013 RepID=UPI00234CE77B|nr:uncharacterized protein LOC128508356 [Clarias gariepinus]
MSLSTTTLTLPTSATTQRSTTTTLATSSSKTTPTTTTLPMGMSSTSSTSSTLAEPIKIPTNTISPISTSPHSSTTTSSPTSMSLTSSSTTTLPTSTSTYSLTTTTSPFSNSTRSSTTMILTLSTSTDHSTSTPSPTSTNAVPADVTAVFVLIFSINETFNQALADTNSPQFATKAKNIRSQVEPLYSKHYKNFKSMDILQFSNGSTKTLANLNFNSNGPNVTESDIKKTLLDELVNLTFPVIPNSINAIQILGNSMPPIIASSFSMIWMSVLSLLLSLSLHF